MEVEERRLTKFLHLDFPVIDFLIPTNFPYETKYTLHINFCVAGD